MDNHTKVEVSELPYCNVCQTRLAKYDAKTLLGGWAYLCKGDFKLYTNGQLGFGRGQELILKQ